MPVKNQCAFKLLAYGDFYGDDELEVGYPIFLVVFDDDIADIPELEEAPGYEDDSDFDDADQMFADLEGEEDFDSMAGAYYQNTDDPIDGEKLEEYWDKWCKEVNPYIDCGGHWSSDVNTRDLSFVTTREWFQEQQSSFGASSGGSIQPGNELTSQFPWPGLD